MARTASLAMFAVGDVIQTASGEGTVSEVRGKAWVKVAGVKRGWHPTTELALLNPEFAARYEETISVVTAGQEQEAADKAAQAELKKAEKAAAREAKKAAKAAPAEIEEEVVEV